MTTEPAWSPLGRVAPTALVEARLALHYAAQPLAAAAYGLLPMHADHSHTNLLWEAERSGFVGRELGEGRRGFLDPVGLRLGLLDREEGEASFPLAGKTLPQAFAELAELLRRAGLDVPAAGLELPAYDLPESPLARTEAFAPTTDATTELARAFGNAHDALARLSAELLGGAEVRGWPHHFDLAALLTLDAGVDAESARSVGAGFSPGDGSYPEPYFYVSPWPYPTGELPELPGGGRWHTQGFTAAVLRLSAVVAAGDGAAQGGLADDFLRGAVRASLGLLGS